MVVCFWSADFLDDIACLDRDVSLRYERLQLGDIDELKV